MGAAAAVEARFNQAADDVMAQQITVSRVFTFLFPVIFLVANLGQAAVLYFGGRQIIGGTLTIGQWQEFSLYLIYLFLPLAQFGLIITQMGQTSVSAGRVFEILDAHNDVTDKPGAVPLPPVQGHVRFNDVSFRYFGSSEPVLRHLNFKAEPGQTIALLGATGSGKTSIINLLPRFYDATSGSIEIDGHDVREVTLDSLRSQIGIVLQETTLFSGAIRDNIAFGKTDASLDEIIEAARAAAAHDFITAFPQGYDTPVGERGSTMSGGQKQRIAIARALLLNPRLLILDDSTSSVDLATEAQIQHALDRLMQGRTSFVIAHRLSTIRISLPGGAGRGSRLRRCGEIGMKNNNQPALIKRMTSRLAAVLRLVAEQVGTRPLPQLRFSQTFAAFQHRNYRLWFAGQLISLVGTWMQTTAQGYLVFQLTRSPIYLGYVGFAAGVPSWLFMLYAAPVATQRVELTRRVAELVRQLGPAQLEELATVITRLETSLKESQWRN